MLDKSKPFGFVSGITGVRYTQGGEFFDASGVVVGEKKEAPKPEKPQAPPQAEPVDNDVLALLDKTIPEIREMLPALEPEEVNALYVAELNGKTRSTLIAAIDEFRQNAI